MPQIRSIPNVELIANFSEHFWLTDEYWFRAWLDRRNALRMSLLRGPQWVTYVTTHGELLYAVASLYPCNHEDGWIMVTPHGLFDSFRQTNFLMTFTEAVHAQMCVDAENQDAAQRIRADAAAAGLVLGHDAAVLAD